MRPVTLAALSAFFLFAASARTMADGEQPKVADLWDRLATADEGQATRAVLALSARPKEAVALLGQKMKAVKVDRAKVAAWIAQLGEDSFTRREEASRELARLGKFIRDDLEKAATTKDPEVKKRIATLLKKLPAEPKKGQNGAGLRGRNVQVVNINGQITITIDGAALDLNPQTPPPDLPGLQTTRGIALLEHFGTPEARKILARLAKGDGEAAATKEAKAALKRLEKR
jgi:hypothetical protein